ncbi:hypothetical protein [Neobacillus jeddahensis]|uniref:hypothetical protein n=1 Tax=Neobacillus jeddahensis TaxID=1461580 RepID=UPI0005915D28|nr:hypothetical protein [Neobacillus jeddahensis]
MQLNFNQAGQLKGRMIHFKNNQGEWTIGRVVEVRKDGLEIEEMSPSSSHDGYGYGFFGPRPFFRPPFFRPPVFFPFVGFAFAPFFF